MLFRNRLPEEVTDPQIDGILTVENEPCQVSYYLSALQYLKYLGQNKKLTERALKLQNSKSELVSDIYNQLLEDKLFGKAYHAFKATGQVNIDKVASDLKKESQRLSESTLRRRASTIRSWVEWMYGIDKVNEMNPLFQARKNQKNTCQVLKFTIFETII